VVWSQVLLLMIFLGWRRLREAPAWKGCRVSQPGGQDSHYMPPNKPDPILAQLLHS
jgi:hypothetical protein